MTKKKIDQRIRTLIENNVLLGHRSFFVLIGDHGRDQVVNLHYILSKAQVARRPSVLWCYKKELGFTSHQKKRMGQLKKKKMLGNAANSSESGSNANPFEDPFELFLSQTEIRYTYYSESEKILGNTYGMCVLQDFEAITPNLLARTIETVQGGGIVVLLLKTISSLKQLYTMSMDSHARYRTSTRFDTVNRFNERFLLSLTTNPNCLVLTDTLDVVPFSQYSLKVDAIERNESDDLGKMVRVTQEQAELDNLKAQITSKFDGVDPLKTLAAMEAPLVALARTLDQAKAIQAFLASIIGNTNSPLNLRNVVSLTAGRGRGKSATMGLAIAAAIASGISNVFITSPSPDNLKTLFEFVLKGLEALGYTEHVDYDLVQSTNPDFNKAIVRINVHRINGHRQTILYVAPGDAQLLGQAELVVIDEAAAIPLPLVQALISGPHMSWMASTINGYEGTGRSLSLKLLSTLRESSGASLKELKLDEPIRYSAGDPVEKWLNSLLCLDIPLTVKNLAGQCPHPEACELYALNRDTLFSFHKASEAFLQRMMTLYVASHYKNSPNDLQLMSDAPAHKLFVLLPPMDTATSSGLPEILAVVQVALEGSLSRQVILNSFARGKREAGDLIPWTVSQQFQEDEFASLSGARIVRIAVHPEMQGMGYGSRALQLIERFYRGELVSPNPEDLEDDPEDLQQRDTLPAVNSGSDLMNEVIKPRAQLKPLLTKVSDLRPPRLDWIGVSFGLTASLFKFYRRLQYLPVYLRQTTNDITGEHSTIMLKSIVSEATWLNEFNDDFKRRFVALCSYQFRTLPITLSLNILEPGKSTTKSSDRPVTISPYDLKRLESYANNMLDYHMILDLIPALARAFFLKQLPEATSNNSDSAADMSLSPVQSAILFSIGLQHRPIEDLESELKLPSSQVLAMFIKVVRKFALLFRSTRLAEIAAAEEPKKRSFGAENQFEPCSESLADDLEDGGKQAISALKEQQRAIIDSLPLDQFAIKAPAESDAAWSEELARKSSKLASGAVISVPRSETISKSASKELYDKYVAVDNNVPLKPKKKKPKTSKKN
jgi:N-acetyltransferase 10